jgi:outer membrane biosynthesis protein TonB
MVGVAVAALLGAVVIGLSLGESRRTHLRCRVLGCSVEEQLATLCRVAGEVVTAPPESRAAAFLGRYADTWPAAAGGTLLQTLQRNAPADRLDLLLDGLESLGAAELDCPPLVSIFGATVAVTPRRLTVNGQTRTRLVGGRLPAGTESGSELLLASLAGAVQGPGAEVRVAVHPALPFETFARVGYGLGLAGASSLVASALDRPDGSATFQLPVFGACPGCPVETRDLLPHLGAARETLLLALLGRRAAAGAEGFSPAADSLSLVVGLESSGAVRVAARGGVLPPRGGPAEGPTIPATADGPDLKLLTERLRAVEKTYPEEKMAVFTADLDAPAGHLLAMVSALDSAPAASFPQRLLGLTEGQLRGGRELAAPWRGISGVELATTAWLAALAPPAPPAPAEPEPPAAVEAPPPEPRAEPPPAPRAEPVRVATAEPLPEVRRPPRPARAEPPAKPAAPAEKREEPRREPPAPPVRTASKVEPIKIPVVESAPLPEQDDPSSPEALASAIRPQLKAMRDCYERELRKKPGLQGRVVVSFELLETGRVDQLRIEDQTLRSPQAVACMERRVRGWRLPPRTERISVSYPLVFVPTNF